VVCKLICKRGLVSAAEFAPWLATERSGEDIVADVPETAHGCPGREDDLIFDLAAEVGALLIVSSESDRLAM
jgi:hypothetical protein